MRIPTHVLLVGVLLSACASDETVDAGPSPRDASTRDGSSHLLDASGLDAAAGDASIITDVDCDPVCSYDVVATYPHDRDAFTQGLVIEGSVVYEGTGLRGQSTVRHVDLQTGVVSDSISLANQYFGEGITIWQDQILQLTWQSQTGFVYDKGSLQQVDQFGYSTEGWGITHDGARLIMSDGSATLYFLDPSSFQQTGSIEVHDTSGPIAMLNELEYIEGEIFANVWRTDFIIRISPVDGRVVGKIDLTGLEQDRASQEAVLNGIAYDDQSGRLYVTGKLWPRLYEIRPVPM